jgi:hypothetical protein
VSWLVDGSARGGVGSVKKDRELSEERQRRTLVVGGLSVMSRWSKSKQSKSDERGGGKASRPWLPSRDDSESSLPFYAVFLKSTNSSVHDPDERNQCEFAGVAGKLRTIENDEERPESVYGTVQGGYKERASV